MIAASIAIVQTDIKKALAYSTISQLGFMICALGVGGYTAGSSTSRTTPSSRRSSFSQRQRDPCRPLAEMPEMGGLRKKMPITFWTFPDRHTVDLGRAAALGLLQQGRQSSPPRSSSAGGTRPT